MDTKATNGGNNNSDYGESLSWRAPDPERCHRCEVQYKLQKKEQQQPPSSESTSGCMPLLEATIYARTVRVRVTPEPVLEATVDGRDIIICYVKIDGQKTCGGGNNNSIYGESPAKQVTWGSPLEEEEEALPTDAKSQQIQSSSPRHFRTAATLDYKITHVPHYESILGVRNLQSKSYA